MKIETVEQFNEAQARFRSLVFSDPRSVVCQGSEQHKRIKELEEIIMSCPFEYDDSKKVILKPGYKLDEQGRAIPVT